MYNKKSENCFCPLIFVIGLYLDTTEICLKQSYVEHKKMGKRIIIRFSLCKQ